MIQIFEKEDWKEFTEMQKKLASTINMSADIKAQSYEEYIQDCINRLKELIK